MRGFGVILKLTIVDQTHDWTVHFCICRRELGLLERLSGEAVTSLVNQRIKHHVELTCRGNFESPYLEQLEEVSAEKIFFVSRVR